MGDLKEITVVARDRIGLLADISEALSERKINIESISVETSERTAIIRLILQDSGKAKSILEGKGMKVMNNDCLVVGIPDHPGELAKLSRLLADHKVHIESAYVLDKEGEKTVLALKISDYKKAKDLLRKRRYL